MEINNPAWMNKYWRQVRMYQRIAEWDKRALVNVEPAF